MIETEYLFDMTVDMGEPVVLGATPHGQVTFQHAIGGSVRGPRVSGILLPIGGDRAVTRADGVAQIAVQALIRTDDGASILMSYDGIIDATREAWGDVAAGRPAAPESFYWRTAPMFETGDARYLWLNRLLAVGVGIFDGRQVRYRVDAIK